MRYNSANPSSKFDGAMLDVEPGSNPDFQGLLDLYKCLQQKAKASGLGLSAAINAFWNAVVTYNQVTKEAYKHIADVNLNSLVVMVHRNIAGTFDSVSRGATILVGLKQTQTNPSEVLEINNYRDSYLNGLLAGRPATNPMPAVQAQQFPAAGIASAASFTNGSIAPGELISIFGTNIGPATPQTLQVANGNVTTSLGGVRVLFNGVRVQ